METPQCISEATLAPAAAPLTAPTAPADGTTAVEPMAAISQSTLVPPLSAPILAVDTTAEEVQSQSAPTITAPAAASPAAVARPPDDLDAALASLQEGQSAGAVKLAQLIHNHPRNKLEALDRGALRALTAVLEAGYDVELHVHTMAALRSLFFRNDEARTAGRHAIHPMCTVFGAAIESLGEGDQWTNRDDEVNPYLTLALIENTMTALVALLQRNPENAAAASASGVGVHLVRLKALPSLPWPPAGAHVERHRVAAHKTLSAATALSPEGVALKAAMLEACL